MGLGDGTITDNDHYERPDLVPEDRPIVGRGSAHRGRARSAVYSLSMRITLSMLVLAAIPLLLLWYIDQQRLSLISPVVQTETQGYAERTAAIASGSVSTFVRQAVDSWAKDQANELSVWLRTHPLTDPSDKQALNDLRSMAVQPFWGEGITWIYDRSGRVIFHPNRSLEGRSLSELEGVCTGLNEVARVDLESPTNGEIRCEGKPNILAVAPVANTDYLMAAMLPRQYLDDAQDNVRNNTTQFREVIESRMAFVTNDIRRRGTAYISVAFALIALFAILLARTIVKPIRRLTDLMTSPHGGKLVVDPNLKTRDEIGELARAFEKMAGDLVRSRDELMRREETIARANTEIMRLNLDLEAKVQERTRRLEKALEELKSLDKSKDDFISLVSHEMRTPLTSISAYTEALISGGVARNWDQQKSFLTIIFDEAERLTRLINDVLDISRMEAKRMPFNFKEINLASLVEKAVLNNRKTAENKNISLKYKISYDRPELSQVYADYDRTMQVVTNLLSNALKYTPEGGRVRVSLGVERKVDRHGKARRMSKVTVADNGMGIPEADKERVFEKFGQIDSVDYHHEGSGLGLAIARLIVEEHGGILGFTSKLGEGSMFYFTLPLTKDDRLDGEG
ncbi:MAG: ATP-binding protein [Candidatus Alcyoniella australis]|nr:ATP-binding protein [Candidatus Alcyoniella australis]